MQQESRGLELFRKANTDFEKKCEALGWTITVNRQESSGSYIVFCVTKGQTRHSAAYLYSQSTSIQMYNMLAKSVEVIFIRGLTGYDPENTFSKNCPIQVLPESDFLYVLTDWNMKHLGAEPIKNPHFRRSKKSIHIIEEDPLRQIYTHLNALTSRTVAEETIRNHVSGLTEEEYRNKAEGVTQLVHNAIDYYNNASTENIIQRLLNLYYGTVCFMEAEMLATGNKYKNLLDIERITRNGHGMHTFGDAATLDDFYIGFIRSGLFYSWLKVRGIDAKDFAETRKLAETAELKVSLKELFEYIPELQGILQEIDNGYKPRYLYPAYDMSFNHVVNSAKSNYEKSFTGGYVYFINVDGTTDYEWEKNLIESFLGPITIVGKHKESKYDRGGWEAFVQYPEGGNHFDSYNAHKGIGTSVVIQPFLGRTDDWEVYSVVILYALSIIVRYMPHLWARIMSGDMDQYKAVIYQFSRVAERELTQIFLERITNKQLRISHPQSLI